MFKKNKRIVYLIFLIIILLILGLVYYYSSQQDKENNKTGKDEQIPVEATYKNKVVYTTDSNYDTEILRADCQERGGTFNECGSPCSPDAVVCAEVCAYTCENMNQETGEKEKKKKEKSWDFYANNRANYKILYRQDMLVEKLEEREKISFQLLGPTQKQNTELHDGINFNIVEKSLDNTDIKTIAQEGIKDAKVIGEIKEPLRQTEFKKRPAYEYTSVTLGEFKNIVVKWDEEKALHISYSTPDPNNLGHLRIAERMLESLQDIDQAKEAEIENLITLKKPEPGQTIQSPLTIQGRAKGSWFFEGDFPIVLTDWDGKIIAQGIAQAQGEWMTEDYVDFQANLDFEKPNTEISNRGSLILKKDNPSGLPKNDKALEITVYFEK